MKVIKFILIVLLIINVFAFVYINFFVEQEKEITLEEYKQQMGYYGNQEDTLIYPENMKTLNQKYTGQIDLYYFAETFTDLINEQFEKIYQDTKGLTQAQINQYFEENIDTIGETLGILQLQDFNNLVQLLKIYDNQNLEYKNSVVDPDTINVLENTTEFELQINYNEANIHFKVILSNKDNIQQDAVIKFIPII